MRTIALTAMAVLLAGCASPEKRHEQTVQEAVRIGADVKPALASLSARGYQCTASRRRVGAPPGMSVSCSKAGSSYFPPYGCVHHAYIDYLEDTGRIVRIESPSACASF